MVLKIKDMIILEIKPRLGGNNVSIVLEVENLCKTYSDFKLDNLTFQVLCNSITGFIGVNGAGKTTTIKLLFELIKREKGSIKMFGQEYEKHFNELKNDIGVVLDENCFYDTLTMKEMTNIMAPAYKNWSNHEYKKYMNQFELNEKQKIETLSKGMKMKYALALALSHNARFLIMDEPANGLDPLVRDQLDNILIEFKNKDENSVFFSTHITSDLDRIADHIIFIDHGKLIFSKEKEDLKEEYIRIEGSTENLEKQLRNKFILIEKTMMTFMLL